MLVSSMHHFTFCSCNPAGYPRSDRSLPGSPHPSTCVHTSHGSTLLRSHRKSSRSLQRPKARVSYRLLQGPIHRPDPLQPPVLHHLERQHLSLVCHGLRLHFNSHHKPAGLPPSASGRRNLSLRLCLNNSPHLPPAESSASGRTQGCRCRATSRKGPTVKMGRSLSSGERKQEVLAYGRDRSRRRVWYVMFRSRSHAVSSHR